MLITIPHLQKQSVDQLEDFISPLLTIISHYFFLQDSTSSSHKLLASYLSKYANLFIKKEISELAGAHYIYIVNKLLLQCPT